ncbi:MBL fold metallo-hydrolase [Saccharospirillum salsuginis]|uniref:L-ascorbate metabolism protein UlaG, beta-lactamase superfamily n=1 Tax=Saccharospirillum salsuginis TaxID=418750 RepID=A0A918K3A9_9GAMM|nr:MBL fold metallo-hydrolase [Saccharospirillum salsuginis]GGX43243.1 hypothetical protein GCM10007392_07440 [Saccharospirillum salsuginis]
MNITQIRNATVIVNWGQTRLLVDPMLAPKGRIPSLKYATRHRRRNPLVDLPVNATEHLNSVTHCLITHCQKGHFDHLDRTATRWLRDRQIPVICMEVDADFLAKKGLSIQVVLQADQTQPFLDGHITPIPCVHGYGWVGGLMAHGSGYVIDIPNEPKLYIAGDTVYTEAVETCLSEHQPEVSVIPAGGARFDLGGDIIMGIEDAIHFSRRATGQVIANHLEALDHCPVSRNALQDAVNRHGVSALVSIPQDGETLNMP